MGRIQVPAPGTATIGQVTGLTAALAAKQDLAAPLTAISAGTNVAPLAATTTLIESGAKATVSVTLIAFGTWADGQTIAVPGVAAKTIKKTAAGDIDVSGAADVAAGAAIIGAYMAAAAGSLVDYVGTVGQVMTFRAKAYGRALNGQLVSGTLLTAAVAMVDGVDPYDGKTVRSEIVYDAAVNGAAVTIGGLSSAKRYRLIGTAVQNGTGEWVKLSVGADVGGSWIFANGNYPFIPLAFADAAVDKAFAATIEPRRGGNSAVLCHSHSSTDAGGATGDGVLNSGAFSADYTALTVTFSATTRTGWLTVIEETP